VIDFHSHILPAIDDGSKNVEESIVLLDMLKDQGIKTVVATPHFDVQRETPAAFIERRQESYEMLRPHLKKDHPEIILGAEVGYYPGIERRHTIRSLCAGDSNLLLLEMPISEWTEYTVREVVELASGKAMNIALAHAERYIGLQKMKNIRLLNEGGILMQYNADFFLRFGQKRKALKMLEHGDIHLIGSDCHNITMRPPRIGEAHALIKQKLGEGFYSFFCGYGYSLLNTKFKIQTS
jgi:protein-tyrosine phosphatase